MRQLRIQLSEFAFADRSDFCIVQVRIPVLDDEKAHISRRHQIVPKAGRHVVYLAPFHLDRL